MRAIGEQALLKDICRIVCDEAGYRMAWVGYAENDEAKTVRPVAWAGAEDGYLKGANILWSDTERGSGPTGIAIRNGKSCIAQDFAIEAHIAPWREEALARGYRSSIALPLNDESGAVFGAFTIYSAEPNAFTPEEIHLLEELAGDLAFGINVLRARTERNRVEAEIRSSIRNSNAAWPETHGRLGTMPTRSWNRSPTPCPTICGRLCGLSTVSRAS